MNPPPRSVTLEEIIRTHQSVRNARALARNIGDAYLCSRGPVFQAIRSAGTKLGCKFSEDDHSAFYAFPLMGLDWILKSRRVPYLPNFPRLVEMQRKSARPVTLADLTTFGPEPNHLLHETAHYVAFETARRMGIHRNAAAGSTGFVLQSVMAEAFSVACERTNLVGFSDPIGEYFVRMNSYTIPNPPAVKALRKSVSRFGQRVTFRVLFMAFIYSSFLFQSVDERQFDRVIAFANGDAALKKASDLRIIRELISRLAFGFSPAFRLVTQQFFFQHHGYKESITKLMNHDPGVLMDRDPSLAQYAEALCNLAGAKNG